MWVREGLLEKWLSHLMLDYKEELGRQRGDWNDFPSESSTTVLVTIVMWKASSEL